MANEQDVTASAVDIDKEELYTPLDVEEYQIRILSIEPDPEDSQLRCSLTTISLLNPVPYIALSYCWGDPDITQTILVNGHSINVTFNLSYALCQLRANGAYKIWADAISINQGDRQERSLQVQLMRQIFSNAIRVVACVGTDPKITKEAISILSRPICLFIDKHHHKESLMSRLRRGGLQHYPGLNYLEDFKAKIQASKGRERGILDKFFAFPYWRRVWIIQEVAVASKVDIVCDHEWISWKSLAGADAFYQESSSEEWTYVRKIALFREQYQHGARPNLLSAMDQTHDALSTDPRDKIFALLGLCSDGDHLVPHPNYKQSVNVILMNLTKAVMSTQKCLSYIFLPGLRAQEIQESSSWAVNWLSLRGRSTSSFFRPEYGFKILDSTNYNILMVRGALIDTIEPFANRSCNLAVQKSGAMHGARPKYYETFTDMADAIWASLGLDCSGFGDQMQRTRSFFFSRLWTEDGMCQLQPHTHIKILQTCRKGVVSSGTAAVPLRLWKGASETDYNTMDRKGRRHFETSFTNWIEDLGTWDIYNHKLYELQQFTRQRRSPESEIDVVVKNLFKVFHNEMKLITTLDGIIGIAHAHATAGDKVCYIAGCSWPVVLRPAELDGRTIYRLVGGARMRFQKEDPRRNWNRMGRSETFEIV